MLLLLAIISSSHVKIQSKSNNLRFKDHHAVSMYPALSFFDLLVLLSDWCAF
jgi:hypothetical protein